MAEESLIRLALPTSAVRLEKRVAIRQLFKVIIDVCDIL
jgi:hypothetical protein